MFFAFQRGPVGCISLEEGILPEVVEGLRRKGHEVEGSVSGHDRALFGRGHVITKGAWWDSNARVYKGNNVLWAGSDPRIDGMALGY